MTPVVTEPLLGYHPCSIGFLTSDHELVGGQCQVGSLTGAVASERVSEALKGSLRMDGNHSKSAKAEGSLTATPTGGAVYLLEIISWICADGKGTKPLWFWIAGCNP